MHELLHKNILAISWKKDSLQNQYDFFHNSSHFSIWIPVTTILHAGV
jgi:hypothetical protein